MAPSDYDPCIFMGEHTICYIYIYDCLFFPKENNYIDALVTKMWDQKN